MTVAAQNSRRFVIDRTVGARCRIPTQQMSFGPRFVPGRRDSEALVLHLHDMNNIMFHGRQGCAVFMRTLQRSFIDFFMKSVSSSTS